MKNEMYLAKYLVISVFSPHIANATLGRQFKRGILSKSFIFLYCLHTHTHTHPHPCDRCKIWYIFCTLPPPKTPWSLKRNRVDDTVFL